MSSDDDTTQETTMDTSTHREQAARLVADMTLQERAGLCSGDSFWTTRPIERLDVPSAFVADGPHGVRRAASGAESGLTDALPATCFPTASALASTWDPALVERVGAAIGREARALEVDVVLGPGANLKRSPLCGRNFEYFSEDPHLTGRIGAAHVAGIQSTGVGTSLKHFVANNQETRRMTIDAVVDERTLRELYLAGFEHVVRTEQPWTVMCSYNRINGTYASDNHHLLTKVLRDAWGFEGLVVTDWSAMNDRVDAVVAGCDLEMPGPVDGAEQELVAAVEDGRLDVAALDAVAARVVELALRSRAQRDPDATADHDEHHRLAREAAARACVLLRDEGHLLPLAEGSTVAVLGTLATEPRFQGTGSSRINPTRVDPLLGELRTLHGDGLVTHSPGYDGPDDIDERVLAQAVATARAADVAVVVVGLPDAYENEGDDRDDLRLPPAHDALVGAVAAAHERVVVVVVSGAPVELPWVHDVGAVVAAYLGGQAAGSGLADVLTGAVAPGGRLAETWPLRLEDVPSTRQFPGGRATVEYREGLYVGYRHTETTGVDVLFPFGHGLGYVPVTWADAQLDVEQVGDDHLRAGGTVTVTVELTNDGDVATSETVQVYVRDVEAAVHRPDRELGGFTTVALAPGVPTTATVELDRRAFAWWDVEAGEWVVEGGTFEVLVAASARDVRATLALHVDGAEVALREAPDAYARPRRFMAVDRAAFEVELGHAAPAADPPLRPFTRSSSIGDAATVPQGRALQATIERSVRSKLGDSPEVEPLIHSMTHEAPLRAMTQFGLTLAQIDTVIDVLNGEWGAGARRALDLLTSAVRDR